MAWTNTSSRKVSVNHTMISGAYNEYKALGNASNRMAAYNLIFVGYTWSRNHGICSFPDSHRNGQADGNITASCDYYPYVDTDLHPTDHTHRFKAYMATRSPISASRMCGR